MNEWTSSKTCLLSLKDWESSPKSKVCRQTLLGIWRSWSKRFKRMWLQRGIQINNDDYFRFHRKYSSRSQRYILKTSGCSDCYISDQDECVIFEIFGDRSKKMDLQVKCFCLGMFWMNSLMRYVVYQMEGHSISWSTREEMSSSIRWFVSKLIECYCYWRFVNCRGSCHQRQMEQNMLNTLDISCFSF